MRKYVIMSLSEKGYWNNENGWVYDFDSATQFTESEIDSYGLPLSAKNDALLVMVIFGVNWPNFREIEDAS